MTVWKDYAIQLHDAINKNHMLKEPLIVMLSLGKIKDVTDKYPLSVQNIKYGSRLYVNTDITEIQEFCDSSNFLTCSPFSLCVPFYSGRVTDDKGVSQWSDCYCLTVGTVDEVFIDAPWSYDSCPYYTTTLDPSKIGSSCCSCQNQVNYTVPRLATRSRYFHPVLMKYKTWAVRFKYRSQLRQSYVLDVSEEPHHIQTLTTTFGLKGEASIGKEGVVEPESSPPSYHPTVGLTNV
ncbi:hypothetical protein GmHk_20G057759 [Glycine max]|nr:hypothetical protein GmHk_20G057759 [Glycine max]